MVDGRRLATNCGLAAATVGLAAVVVSILLASPETFTWSSHALSDMGWPQAETFWTFNGGLVLAGLLGLPFGWRLWITSRNRLERAGVIALGVALAGLIGVGVFFLGHTDYYLDVGLHFHAAVTLFVAAPVAQLVYGSGQFVAGDRGRGRLSVGFAVAQFAGWLVWQSYSTWLAPDPWAWFALPELWAAALVTVWIVLLTRWVPQTNGN